MITPVNPNEKSELTEITDLDNSSIDNTKLKKQIMISFKNKMQLLKQNLKRDIEVKNKENNSTISKI